MSEIKKITSPGCTGCKIVEEMLDELKVKYNVIDITKKPKILEKYQMMSAPGIVINGKLEFSGVPSKEKLKKKLGK